jgi:hypothetical protein
VTFPGGVVDGHLVRLEDVLEEGAVVCHGVASTPTGIKPRRNRMGDEGACPTASPLGTPSPRRSTG